MRWIAVLGGCFLLGVQVIYASDLSDAFHALLSTTNLGVYHAQVRGYMAAGSVNVHFPVTSKQIIDLAPPQYSAGCSGINLFMGGMSYISGDEFVNLLKGIAANAMGYSFSLAMRTLCPICSSVVSDLQRAAQSASNLSIHQCQFAQGLVNTVTGDQAVLKAKAEGALSEMQSGKTASFLSGISSIGGNVAKAFDAIAQDIHSVEDRALRNQKAQATQYGSTVWKALGSLNFAQKVFVQSILGTVARYPNAKRSPSNIIVRPVASSMTLHQLSNLLMYGVQAKNPNNANLIVNSCDNTKETGNIFDKKGINLCSIVVKRKIKNSLWYRKTQANVHGLSLSDYGFFGLTYAIIFQALNSVQHNVPLGSVQSITLPEAIYGVHKIVMAQFSKEEINSFINLAPVPLYRAINIAALYSSIADALVNNISEIVAAHYALSYMNAHIFNTSLSDNSKSGDIGISLHDIGVLRRTLQQMRAHIQKKIKIVLDNIQVNQAWSQKINQIQSKIYANVLSKGIGNDGMASGFLKGGV